MSKCIFDRRKVANNIILIKFIDSYQYIQHIRSILSLDSCDSFLCLIARESCFLIFIFIVCRISLSKEICRRSCLLSVFNFKNRDCMRFTFFTSLAKRFIIVSFFSSMLISTTKDFVNCKISLKRIYFSLEFFVLSNQSARIMCKDNDSAFFSSCCIIFSQVDDYDEERVKNLVSIKNS